MDVHTECPGFMNKVEQKDPFLNVRTPIYAFYTPSVVTTHNYVCAIVADASFIISDATYARNSLNNVDLCHDKLSVA